MFYRVFFALFLLAVLPLGFAEYQVELLSNADAVSNGIGGTFDVNFALLDYPSGVGNGGVYDVNLGPFYYSLPTVSRVAQSFKLAGDWSGQTIKVKPKRIGVPDNLVFSLQTDSGGAPSGVELASATYPVLSVDTSYNWKTINWGSTVSLSHDTNYWIVATIESGMGSGNYYVFDGQSGYADGMAMFFDNYAWADDGVTDYAFQIAGFGATIVTTNIIPVLNVNKLVLVSLQSPDSNITFYVTRNGADWQYVDMNHIGNERLGVDSYFGLVTAWSHPDESKFAVRAILDENSQLDAVGAKWRWSG